MLALSVLLLLVAGQAAIAEIGPVLRDPQAGRLRVAALIDGDLQPAYSTYSHKVVLRTCVDALSSPYAKLLPAQRRSALLAACGDIAEAVVSRTPTSGFGWLLAGLVAQAQGRPAAAGEALARSRALSPSEYWLARMRSEMVERYYDDLGPLVPGHAADLTLTLQGQPGRNELAQLYWSNPTARERLTEAAEALLPDQQRLFLAAVQQARPGDAR